MIEIYLNGGCYFLAAVRASETNGFSVPGSALAPKIFGIRVEPGASWQSCLKGFVGAKNKSQNHVEPSNQGRMSRYGFGVDPAAA